MDKKIKNTDEDYIPPKAIKVFIQMLTGNENMPLEQGVQHPGLVNQLKPLETLPLPVQKIISEIRAADSIEEKAAIAHIFSQAYIQDIRQNSKLGEERYITFEELTRDPRGDCDDHQLLSTGLLLHGGVNPRNIFMLNGMINYQGNNAAHAFIVVQDNNNYILLDNNLYGTPQIDPKNPIVNGVFADEIGNPLKAFGKTVETKVEIIFLSSAIDGRGTPFENNQAQKLLEDYTSGFIQAMKNANAPARDNQLKSSTPANISPNFNSSVQNIQNTAASQTAAPQKLITLTTPSAI